jgi:hypothetical protein
MQREDLAASRNGVGIGCQGIAASGIFLGRLC